MCKLMGISEVNLDTVAVGDFSSQLKINKETSGLTPYELNKCLVLVSKDTSLPRQHL